MEWLIDDIYLVGMAVKERDILMDKRKELSNLNDYQIRQFRKYFKELENLVEEFSEELNDKRDNLVEELIWLIESNHIFSLPNVIFIIV